MNEEAKYYSIVTDVLRSAVLDSKTALDIQYKAHSLSESLVLVDYRVSGKGGVAVRVYVLDSGVYVPFIPDSDYLTHYRSILGRVESCVNNDPDRDKSLSQAFLRNRLIRALTSLTDSKTHINKSNLEFELNRIDGREKILPKFIKASSVRDVSFEITEFARTIKSKIADLNIEEFFPCEEQRKSLREVIMKSKAEVIEQAIYRDVGFKVKEGDPRLPTKIEEIKK
ncbi:hypothetical protein [Vibrio sp. D431a]|uniref:hypothetical protein n=1 Tax=Vibrio sp. D431a TaxID=2837388 RepID=UPI002554CF09|nr:hypothetical protein [Vibrio sp. D431a]MDK9793249.1 hypothetical protein [Vibrio sp. D431a]